VVVRPGTPPIGGLQGLSDFIEVVVPQPQREQAAATLVRILNGALFELLNVSLERAGQRPWSAEGDAGEPVREFMTQAVLALSDAAFY
ncbi:hypothetical protein, partial [Lacticaseibacillus paracasei]